MADLKVRIEELPRMRVAAVIAISEAPEIAAWRKLREWATPKGLWSDFDRHPIFGFNNPSPSSGSKEYGYELWIRGEAPEAGQGPVTFKQFEGGLFAVTACRLLGAVELGANRFAPLAEGSGTGESGPSGRSGG